MPARHAPLAALAALSALAAGAPAATTAGQPSYTTRGAIEVDTNENTLFLWHGELFVLENIPCYYSQHASNWDPAYANSSYARVREMGPSGSIVANISQTIGFGFVSAYVDEDHDKVWLFGSACNRCTHGGPQGCANKSRVVQAWSNSQDTSSLGAASWSDGVPARGTAATFNVEVTRVRSSFADQAAVGLPAHTHAMIMEIGTLFALNNAPSGDLTTGWFPVPGATSPRLNGGPSIRWNPLDSMYYAILGGHTVELIRTKDFKTWERSKNAPFIQPTAADGQVSPYAGFAAVARERGFLPMENTSLWDWNSNDADVCCITKDQRSIYAKNASWVVWGAGTQGREPRPPLTKANHCANVVATADVSLPELLISHFE